MVNLTKMQLFNHFMTYGLIEGRKYCLEHEVEAVKKINFKEINHILTRARVNLSENAYFNLMDRLKKHIPKVEKQYLEAERKKEQISDLYGQIV